MYLSHIRHFALVLAAVSLTGCDSSTGISVASLSDPRVAPLLQAMAASDRSSMGFSSVPSNAVVYLINPPLPRRRDADIRMFDTEALYQDVYRYVQFRQTATGYVWEFEMEVHPGPKTFFQSGNTDHQWHTAHEEISISYDTTGSSGVTPNKVHVRYHGPTDLFSGSRLPDGKDLTLDEVRPVLEEWRQKR
jgi:hypothetical protein